MTPPGEAILGYWIKQYGTAAVIGPGQLSLRRLVHITRLSGIYERHLWIGSQLGDNKTRSRGITLAEMQQAGTITQSEFNLVWEAITTGLFDEVDKRKPAG